MGAKGDANLSRSGALRRRGRGVESVLQFFFELKIDRRAVMVLRHLAFQQLSQRRHPLSVGAKR
jgi:hypothetical protein